MFDCAQALSRGLDFGLNMELLYYIKGDTKSYLNVLNVVFNARGIRVSYVFLIFEDVIDVSSVNYLLAWYVCVVTPLRMYDLTQDLVCVRAC